jgi:hypothetical protein
MCEKKRVSDSEEDMATAGDTGVVPVPSTNQLKWARNTT